MGEQLAANTGDTSRLALLQRLPVRCTRGPAACGDGDAHRRWRNARHLCWGLRGETIMWFCKFIAHKDHFSSWYHIVSHLAM